MSYTKVPILSSPGLNRDGTRFSSSQYLEMVHARFLPNGQPVKMRGWRQILVGDDQISRSIAIYNASNLNTSYSSIFLGRPGDDTNLNAVLYFNIVNGRPDHEAQDFTPATYHTHPFNIWDFRLASFFSTDQDLNLGTVLAHAAQTLNSIDSSVDLPIYSTDLQNPGNFVPLPPTKYTDNSDPPQQQQVAAPQVNGGICVSDPYLFVYGERIRWSIPNNPFIFPVDTSGNPLTEAVISAEKIVAAHPTRLGQSSTLFWSLSRLYLAQFEKLSSSDTDVPAEFKGEVAIFNFSEIERNLSILSPRSIVRYNQRFYWIGFREIFFYNGTVDSMKNMENKEWFFDHLDMNHLGKMYGYTIPAFYELCWPFVRNDSARKECTHELVFNVALNKWYDRPLNRSGGTSDNYPYPLMLSNVSSSDNINLYSVFQHEIEGMDEFLINGKRFPILSSVTTAFQKPQNDLKNYDLQQLELDTYQVGNLTLDVFGIGYPSSPVSLLRNTVVPPNSARISINREVRYPAFQFTSHELGGYFQLGNSSMIVAQGSEQPMPTPPAVVI